jgi:aspartyl protease family protein
MIARQLARFGFVMAMTLSIGWWMSSPRAERPAEPVSAAHFQLAAAAPEELRLKRRGNGHFYTHAMVDGQIVEFLVDTGASNVVLTVADARRVGLPVNPAAWEVIGTGASGAVRGEVLRAASVELEGRILTNVDVMVAQGLTQSLLGQDFLRHMKSVTMSRDLMVLR